MGLVIAHFFLGTMGAGTIFLLFQKLSGEPSFSLSFSPIIVGLNCGIMAQFSPWATPTILGLYGLVYFYEWYGDRH